jgi:predicted nucleic acid-binding protein
MTRLLLDTTVLIDFSLGREPATSGVLRFLREGHELGVSAVSIAEFYAGVKPGDLPTIDRFISQLPCWDTTRSIAMIAGDYRYTFKHSHQKKLLTPDALIAATARHQQATLLTNNVKDFPMTDITVERLGS